MTFARDRLPEPAGYYEGEGLVLTGRGRWRTTRCAFHGGSDSMRVNVETGSFCCMAACGARGGDVLAYHMAAHGVGFVEAARALGAWDNDGRPDVRRLPAGLPARDALELLRTDAMLVAVAAGNVAQGVALSDEDRRQLMAAAARVLCIAEGGPGGGARR